MIDPYSQMDYGVHLHASGLIDQNQEIQINKTIHKIQKLISMKQFDQAFKLFVPLVFNSDSNSMLYNFTGQLFHYNVLVDSVPQLVIDFNDFMQDPQVRRAFHVYPNNFNENDKVGQMMKSDILKSIKHKFALLANNYPTILWSGQLDIIIPPLFTENFLNQLDWKYSDTFATADRLVWRLEDEKEKVAGYVKQVNNFWYVVVKRAGHMVPWDQPKVAFEMIKKFVYDSI